jgi:hypothetical protein
VIVLIQEEDLGAQSTESMSPPSYAHRHILCSELLASRPAPPDHSPFSLGWAESSKSADVRSRKLDHLLLQGWAGKGKGREAAVDDDSALASSHGIAR